MDAYRFRATKSLIKLVYTHIKISTSADTEYEVIDNKKKLWTKAKDGKYNSQLFLFEKACGGHYLSHGQCLSCPHGRLLKKIGCVKSCGTGFF